MTTAAPKPDAPTSPPGDARALNKDIKRTIRDAMARAGAVGAAPAREADAIIQQARRPADS